MTVKGDFDPGTITINHRGRRLIANIAALAWSCNPAEKRPPWCRWKSRACAKQAMLGGYCPAVMRLAKRILAPSHLADYLPEQGQLFCW